jgi:putative transposase
MNNPPPPGNKALRRSRYSQAYARYFITICTNKRDPVLCCTAVPKLIFDLLNNTSGSFQLIASVVMPDHLHLILELKTAGLTKAMQAFKSCSAIAINKLLGRSGAVWQPAFFDHRIRNDDELGPILNYIWNNAEPSGLNFRCRKEDWLWFKSKVTKDASYPEWLSENPMG